MREKHTNKDEVVVNHILALCNTCNKEYDILPMMSIARHGRVINICDCPHCENRNDHWLHIK